MSLNEVGTCLIYVPPKLREAGWEILTHAITEQHAFTNGRVKLTGENIERDKRKNVLEIILFRLSGKSQYD